MAEKLLRYWAPCVMLIGTETPKRAFVSKAVCDPAVEEVGKELPEVVEPGETGEEHRERVGRYRAEDAGPEHVTRADEDQEKPRTYKLLDVGRVRDGLEALGGPRGHAHEHEEREHESEGAQHAHHHGPVLFQPARVGEKTGPEEQYGGEYDAQRYREEQGHHYGAAYPRPVLVLSVMGDVANNAVLHAEPGEDLQAVDQRDTRGIETVELRPEQAGDDDLGHVPDDTPGSLPGRAYAGAARDLRDVGVVVFGSDRLICLLCGRLLLGDLLPAHTLLFFLEISSRSHGDRL